MDTGDAAGTDHESTAHATSAPRGALLYPRRSRIFTQSIYEARELALARMQAEATQARSSGIVGVNVAVSNHVWGEHATEFLATGTAIRRLAAEHRLPETSPKPTFTLGLDS
ncbi:MAG TPA: heavy metal-binding domain-containing protein [Streptosporangiaceae bacterium]|nr:heavy metal-binding domain-containing protein [Streptosporangiaceae bacterium]